MRRALVAWVALVVLAAISLACSVTGVGGVPVAFGIAAIKAVIVAAVFMELADRPFGLRVVLAVGVGMVALLVGLATADVGTR